MQYKEFKNVKVAGIACAVPDNKVMTDSYVDCFGGEKVERFKGATGIESRYLSDGRQTISDLCYEAAFTLMKKKGYSGDDIDAVILFTQRPDYKAPATAFLIQKRLGIKQDCLVFDVNIGCAAFVYGVYLVSGLIESRTINRALLLVGDCETNHGIYEDTSATMMFGDAGSATIIEYSEGDSIRGMLRADGSNFGLLVDPLPGARFPGEYPNKDYHPRIDGDEVFLFSITKVPSLFKEFFKSFGRSLEDYDYVMLHQANLMIVNQIYKKLKVPDSKRWVSINKFGNTTGASVPLGIVDLCEGKEVGRVLRLINSGFGNGLTWGIVDFDILTDDVMPLVITGEYYKEGKNV